MPSYSEIYKKRMNEFFKSKEKIKQNTQNDQQVQKSVEIPRIKKRKTKEIFFSGAAFLSFFLIVFSIYLNFKKFDPLSIILFLASIVLFLFFTYRYYQKWIVKANKKLILFVVFFILIINMILGDKVYSIEWAFLAFAICGILFYDFEIDSRFMIMPALLLLVYIPFLLVAKENILAEKIAVYVYYFLVIGVILKILEYNRDYNSIDFETFMNNLIKKINWVIVLIFCGILNIGIIIANRFYYLEIWKWTFVYFFVVCLFFYLMSVFVTKK